MIRGLRAMVGFDAVMEKLRTHPGASPDEIDHIKRSVLKLDVANDTRNTRACYPKLLDRWHTCRCRCQCRSGGRCGKCWCGR